MPSILNTGLSGLLSFQRALSTTAHNVSNAATAGYTRQRTGLTAQPGQGSLNGHVGRGVQVKSVERMRDDFVETRLRSAIADDGRTRMYAELAGQLDNLLASEESGLAPTLSNFFASMQDLANDPASTTSRQFALSDAATLVERFRFMDAEIEGLREEMNTRVRSTVSTINALAEDIAGFNESIAIAAGQTPGAPPNDLLDQRDQRVNELAALVGVRTLQQANGALDVFTSSGQALVINDRALSWQAVQDPSDPSLLQVADVNGGIISDKLSGGELGGVLDFRRESLSASRNELGRIAVVLADTFNTQHRAGMDLDGNLGQDFFAVPVPGVTPNAGNAGAATVSAAITDTAQLTASDYRLDYDGASYTMTRMSDGTSVSGAGPLAMDGVEVTIGPGAVAGDRFMIKPVARGGDLIVLALSDPDRIAAAGPVRAQADIANAGDGVSAQPQVVDAANAALLNDVSIVFNNPPTTFDVVDVTAGATLAAGVAYSPGASISANGWSTTISGAPRAGDSFSVQSNVGGVADNRNALELAGLQTRAVIEGRLSLEQGYSGFVGQAGITARGAQLNAEARALLLEDAQFARESISGVNLDEEAVDLSRYQQAYQAMAKVVETGNTLFDTILAAVR